MLGWLALLALGVVAAVRDRQMHLVGLIAGAWIIGNIVLHSGWQFRNAVFLYAAHPQVAVFFFALAGARWAQGWSRPWKTAYLITAMTVTSLSIINNLQLYLALPLLR